MANETQVKQRVEMPKDPYDRAEQIAVTVADIAKQQKWNPNTPIKMDFTFYQVLTSTIADLAREQLAMKNVIIELAEKAGVDLPGQTEDVVEDQPEKESVEPSVIAVA